ncbi:MAG: hypothetical protein BWY06_00533 [Candidatus Latescibacteria bacterium ADurb.Bin168]|nr:MAG: hypothetical protein BWY06_00533 [Candidatus Latescibacteria bacterium ADurb.Bin168]
MDWQRGTAAWEVNCFVQNDTAGCSPWGLWVI